MQVSNCCGAPVYEDTDICIECGEHCEVVDEDEEDYMETWLLNK